MNIEIIKNIREEENLRQEDVANIIGIKRATYASYEILRDTIPIKHLNELCNYFDISIDYALGLTKVKCYLHMNKDFNKEKTMNRLKSLRKANKMSQEEIAKMLNISRSTWTGYEYGKYQIPTLILYELATTYNQSIDYLLGKIDNI